MEEFNNQAPEFKGENKSNGKKALSKKAIIIGAVALAIVVIAVLLVVFLGGKDDSQPKVDYTDPALMDAFGERLEENGYDVSLWDADYLEELFRLIYRINSEDYSVDKVMSAYFGNDGYGTDGLYIIKCTSESEANTLAKALKSAIEMKGSDNVALSKGIYVFLGAEKSINIALDK